MKLVTRNLILISLFILLPLYSNCQMNWNWVKPFGGNDDQYASDMAIDIQGNVYIAGTFWRSVTFGSSVLKANPNYGLGGYITKLDKNGVLIWTKQIAPVNEDKYVNSIIPDKKGNLYVTGSRIQYENSPSYLYVDKYDSNGNLLWSKSFNDYFWDDKKHKTIGLYNSTICIAGKASLYTLDISGKLLNQKLRNVNVITTDNDGNFYGANGRNIWVFDSLLTDKYSIILDSAYTINALTIKDKKLYATGYFDPNKNWFIHMFVAKFDTTGKVIWAKTGGGGENSLAEGNSILINPQNKICVAGTYRGTVNLGKVKVGLPEFFNEAFVAKYSESSGELEDFIHGGGDNEDNAESLALDSENNLFVFGNIGSPYSTTINFGDNNVPFPPSYGAEVYLSKVTKAEITAVITGQITLNNTPRMFYFNVLRENPDNTYTRLTRSQTTDDGKFSFVINKSGNYLVKSDYYEQVGTYYKQTYLWDLAEKLHIVKDTVFDNINIDVIKCPSQSGSDVISGKLFDSDGSSKPFIDILLVDSNNQPSAITHTDTSGNYKFINISSGHYKILVDSAGMYMDSYYAINNTAKSASAYSPEGKTFSNCDYIFGTDHKIYKKMVTSLPVEIARNTLKVYPNPANSYIYLNIPNDKNLKYKIYDLSGRCVFQSVLNTHSSEIYIKFLQKGYYYLKVDGFETNSFIKID